LGRRRAAPAAAERQRGAGRAAKAAEPALAVGPGRGRAAAGRPDEPGRAGGQRRPGARGAGRGGSGRRGRPTNPGGVRPRRARGGRLLPGALAAAHRGCYSAQGRPRGGGLTPQASRQVERAVEVVLEVVVRCTEIVNGHVNNARYVEYLEWG